MKFLKKLISVRPLFEQDKDSSPDEGGDFMPPAEDTPDEISDNGLTLPPMDEEELPQEKKEEDNDSPPEEKKEESNSGEKKEDEKPEGTDAPADSKPSEETPSDDLDLSEMFKDVDKELETSKDIIDKAEDNGGQLSPEEIKSLKDGYESMKSLVDRMTREKTDLMFKNAELEAFGGDFATPELLILSRNLPNVKENPQAKTKVLTVLRNLYEDLSGSDIEQNKKDKEVDIFSATEAYNSSINPEIKKGEDSDDEVMVM